jgi:hypothetical protein
VRSGRPLSGAGAAPLPPWQFAVRGVLVVIGLTLLLLVDVHGFAFYVAWSLIGLALLSEAAATLVHWRHTRAARGGPGPGR